MVLQTRGFDLTRFLGLFFWQGDSFRPWQFFTYMFMHDSSSLQGGLIHLFCNMFNLYMFGALLERMLGAKRYLIYYIVCGLGAGLIQELVWQFTWLGDFASMLQAADGSVPAAAEVQRAIAAGDAHMIGLMNQYFNFHVTVGASGCVFGLLLAFGMSFPNLRMFIIPFPFPIKAKWMVIGYGVFELVAGTKGLMTGVAHFAHLGGMLFGILMILYWRHTGVIRRNEYM